MLDSYRDLIDGFLVTPTALRDALGTPVPDDVPEPIAHDLRELAVREAVNLRRVLAVMRRERILLLTFEDEPEMQTLASGEITGTPEENLAAFSHDRSELISTLVNLTLKDWERPIDHDRTGETTLADELDDHLTWDETIVARLTTA